MEQSALRERIRQLLPGLVEQLKDLVRIPSVAMPGVPNPSVADAYEAVAAALGDAGVQVREPLMLADTQPVLIGEIPGPEGAPTVLLYCHYDVVPADEEGWDTPPFEPVERAGAVFGRGTADSKSNILVHVGALTALAGSLGVGIKVVIEGQEEYGSAFDYYPEQNPDLFQCDAMVIADVGNVRPGEPTLTVALRGSADVTVEVNTLDGPKHSGQFGGAAPDAMLVLIQALSTLHDEKGDVAVRGLHRSAWEGTAFTEEEFRSLGGVRDGIPLQGSGQLEERIWSGPAITVIGFDAHPVDNAVNSVVARARARINLRVHPDQDAREAQAALIAHLEALSPFGVPLTVTAGETGNGYSAVAGGRAYEAAREALSETWGRSATTAAIGGSIPLVSSLAKAVPEAEILLFGAADGLSGIHGPNERVLLEEFENAILAEALFLSKLGGLQGAES